MAFWTAQNIRDRQTSNKPLVINGINDEDRIRASSYELCVGEKVCITDPNQRNAKDYSLKQNGDSVYINPGQFAIITTEEIINIPSEIMAFISMRTGKKMRGLVNVSGFHVDPGYNNHLKFGVYNAGPNDILITRGELLFQIFFVDLNGTTDKPYNNKGEIEPNIKAEWREGLKGNTLSVSEIDSRVKILENALTIAITVAGILLTLGILQYVPSLSKIEEVEKRVTMIEAIEKSDGELMLLRKEINVLKKRLIQFESNENPAPASPVKTKP